MVHKGNSLPKAKRSPKPPAGKHSTPHHDGGEKHRHPATHDAAGAEHKHAKHGEHAAKH